MVGENGGGAFVLLYVLLALIVGLPLLIGELLLGKSQRRSVVASLKNIVLFDSGAKNRVDSKNFYKIGVACVLVTLVVLSYYAVVSGWVLHFLMRFLSEFFTSIFSKIFGQSYIPSDVSFARLMSNGPLQIGLASVHILLASIIVLKGIEEGLERTVAIVMPVFVILLFLLGIQAVSLPSFTEAMRFFFYPDFSRLTSSSVIHAIGHLCFTMSVGFGVMVTFGSHLADRVFIPAVGFRVMIVDTLLSIFSGVMVFAIALSASNVPLTDPGLLFSALPQFMLKFPGGIFFGVAFFLCFYLAALSASIGLLEVIVSNLAEIKGWSRPKATLVAGSSILGISIFPAVSSTILLHVRPLGKGLLEFLDAILINWCLPILAVAVGWILVNRINSQKLKEYFIEETHPDSILLFPYWTMALKWMVPIVLIFALFLQFVGMTA